MDQPSSTLTDAPSAAPSTRPAPRHVPIEVGDIVLLKLDESIRRPLLVSWVGQVDVALPSAREPHYEPRVSGTLFCQPDDHATPAIRTLGEGSPDPARITGRPDRLLPQCYAEYVREGMGIGEWIARPTKLPSRA
jgi:hypothetical protein